MFIWLNHKLIQNWDISRINYVTSICWISCGRNISQVHKEVYKYNIDGVDSCNNIENSNRGRVLSNLRKMYASKGQTLHQQTYFHLHQKQQILKKNLEKISWNISDGLQNIWNEIHIYLFTNGVCKNSRVAVDKGNHGCCKNRQNDGNLHIYSKKTKLLVKFLKFCG